MTGLTVGCRSPEIVAEVVRLSTSFVGEVFTHGMNSMQVIIRHTPFT